MSDKQTDAEKLIEKMRSNTQTQNRKTIALPRRRTYKKAQKVNHKAEAAAPTQNPASES